MFVEGKLKRLGIAVPNYSTLAYANEHRPWQLYQKISTQLDERPSDQANPKKEVRV